MSIERRDGYYFCVRYIHCYKDLLEARHLDAEGMAFMIDVSGNILWVFCLHESSQCSLKSH